MDKEKALAVLAVQLGRYRRRSYAALRALIGEIEAYEIETPDGLAYQIEIQVFWDDKPGGDIRVGGAVDDGGWRAYAPLTDDFIISPDGSFVDE